MAKKRTTKKMCQSYKRIKNCRRKVCTRKSKKSRKSRKSKKSRKSRRSKRRSRKKKTNKKRRKSKKTMKIKKRRKCKSKKINPFKSRRCIKSYRLSEKQQKKDLKDIKDSNKEQKKNEKKSGSILVESLADNWDKTSSASMITQCVNFQQQFFGGFRKALIRSKKVLMYFHNYAVKRLRQRIGLTSSMRDGNKQLISMMKRLSNVIAKEEKNLKKKKDEIKALPGGNEIIKMIDDKDNKLKLENFEMEDKVAKKIRQIQKIQKKLGMFKK